MNLMDRGQGTLVRFMKGSAGRPVTYTYGTWNGNQYVVTASAPLTVWVGNTLFALAGQDGAAVIHGDRDYLVSVADFQAVFGLVEPMKGDRIQDLDQVTGLPITYELQTPTGEPVWRYSDQTRQAMRLHCKRVS